MFKNTYQNGLLSIFYSCGSNPLLLWDMEVRNGHIKRITDNEVNSIVLEIVSTNVATTYITCPKGNKTLGIKLPFLVMIVKNLKRYFSFEICILDDRNLRRRFRISNFQSSTKIKPFCTTMPLGLSSGWNQIQFNLADFTRRAYGTQYLEATRVQVHANVRLRRIFFCDRLYSEEELPQEYKLFLPLERKQKKVKKEEPGAAPVVPVTKKESKKGVEKKPSAAKTATPVEEVAKGVEEGEPAPTPKAPAEDTAKLDESVKDEQAEGGSEDEDQKEDEDDEDEEGGGEGGGDDEGEGDANAEGAEGEQAAENVEEGLGEGGAEPTEEATAEAAPEPAAEEVKPEEPEAAAEVAE